MSKFSFEDIGAVVATCRTRNGLVGGQVVRLATNAVAASCDDGEAFCGVVMQPRNGIGSVQFKGFMTVSYTGILDAGWATLVADGSGGVRNAAEGESGVTALVIFVNLDNTAVICL